MKVAVVKETAPGERRVALVPETVQKLTQGGLEVLVEKGAGDAAWFPDGTYTEAGAAIVSTDELYATADVILTVTRPDEAALTRLRAGQAVIGLLAPLIDPRLASSLAERGVTAISLDGLPRTLSRAQGMDALTSQANVAGYKAALVAAEAYGRFFPLLITPAGHAGGARDVRPLLPAADRRGGHGAAREAARARHRRRRAAGHRHRPPARRAGQ